MDAGRAPPLILATLARGERHQCLELLAGDLRLAGIGQRRSHRVSEFDQQFDVERCVPKLRGRQRADGPVGCAMTLLQQFPQLALHERGETDPISAKESAREFGVEQGRGPQSHFGEARQVLGGRMQDPLDARRGLLDGRQVRYRDRIDQRGARADATELHEVGALAVAVAGGPLRIKGQGPASGSQQIGVGADGRGIGQDGWHAVARLVRCLRWEVGDRFDFDFRLGQFRPRRCLAPTWTTPWGSGGSPAAWANRSTHADRWAPMSSRTSPVSGASTGVHDARISTKPSEGRSIIVPKDRPEVRVMVPPS